MKQIDMSVFEEMREKIVSEIRRVLESIAEQSLTFKSSSSANYHWIMCSGDNDNFVGTPYKAYRIFIDGCNEISVEYLVLSFTNEEDVYQYTEPISSFSVDEIYNIMLLIKKECDVIDVVKNGKH